MRSHPQLLCWHLQHPAVKAQICHQRLLKRYQLLPQSCTGQTHRDARNTGAATTITGVTTTNGTHIEHRLTLLLRCVHEQFHLAELMEAIQPLGGLSSTTRLSTEAMPEGSRTHGESLANK